MHKFTLWIASLLVVVGTLAGCDLLSTNDEGTGTLRLLLTDAPFPFDLVDEANVTITRIEIVRAEQDEATEQDTTRADADSLDVDDEGEVITLSTEVQAFNLLDLRDGVTAELAEIELPAGTYHQIRLIVTDASVKLKDEATLGTYGGKVFDMKVPSGAQTGIKVPLGGLQIGAGAETTFTLDFDVSRSFVVQGNPSTPAGIKGFIFKPVVVPLRDGQ